MTFGPRLSTWSALAVVLAGLIGLSSWLNSINHIFYRMEPETLARIAKQSVSLNFTNTEDLVQHVVTSVKDAYPDLRVQTDFRDRSEWVWNNAGGAMGSMYIIHASVTEYLIIFGSAVGTEGHSGRHTADDYFHILEGTQTAYEAGSFVKEVYGPGSVHHLKRGITKQYKMDDTCWAMEYARGWIPPMLPFGLADTLFSTLDLIAFYHTARITGREMFFNLIDGKL